MMAVSTLLAWSITVLVGPIGQGVLAWSGWHGLRTRLAPFRRDGWAASHIFRSSQQLGSDPQKRNAAGVDKAAELVQEAEELRLRAKQLMAEALSMEADLKESKSFREKEKKGSADELLQKIFDSRPLTPEAVAQVMRNEKVSSGQAHFMVEQLHVELLRLDPELAMGIRTIVPTSLDTSSDSQIPGPRNPSLSSESASFVPGGAVDTPAMAELVANRLECLIKAAQILDNDTETEAMSSRWPSSRVSSSLRSHWNQLRRTAQFNFQRAAMLQQQTREQDPTETSGDHQNETGAILDTGYQGNVVVPPWLPSRILALFSNTTSTTKPSSLCAEEYLLSPEDIRAIKQDVLTGTRFVCTSSESIPCAAIFRGNIRFSDLDTQNASPSEIKFAKDRLTASVYDDLVVGMKRHGLQDRVQLFLMADPAEQIDIETPTPVVLAIPANVAPSIPRKFGFFRRGFAKLSVVLAAITLFEYSVSCYALNPKFFRSIVNQHNAAIISICAPVFWGITGIQLLHELVHLIIARNRGIRTGWPLPFPSYELGTFGCVTALKSFPANRKDLFDFSIGGPAAAGLSSLACVILGIHKTVHASTQSLANFPVLPVASLKSSFLVGALLTFLAPKLMSLPLSQPIPIHPLFVIGFSGLISSALNLLPIFRLDGGRACDAAMGPRYGEFASASTLMFLFSTVISKGSAPFLLTWFVFILAFQRTHDIPSQDELTSLSRVRFSGWVCALALSILALLPFPGYSRPELFRI